MADFEFQQRMATVIDLIGGVSALAASSGLSAGVVAKYRNGESDPSRERLVAMARAASVRVAWLATGEGPMRPDEHRPPDGDVSSELVRAVAQYVLAADVRAPERRSPEELADVIAQFIAHGQRSGIDLEGWRALQTALDHFIDFAPGRRA